VCLSSYFLSRSEYTTRCSFLDLAHCASLPFVSGYMQPVRTTTSIGLKIHSNYRLLAVLRMHKRVCFLQCSSPVDEFTLMYTRWRLVKSLICHLRSPQSCSVEVYFNRHSESIRAIVCAMNRSSVVIRINVIRLQNLLHRAIREV
jgi:hypothetical protein